MQNSIVVHVCPMNFFYVFIVPGPILRHLSELVEIRLLLIFLCRICLHLFLAWSHSMKLNISGDIWILSDFRHLT
jgi:hypothetical protein